MAMPPRVGPAPQISTEAESPIGNQKRKRGPRAAVACDSCRTRKVKCDAELPCSSCVHHSFQCSYTSREGHPVHYTSKILVSSIGQTRYSSSPTRDSQTEIQSHSLGGGDISSIGAASTNAPGSQTSEPPAPTDHDLGGLGDVNQHTEGSEFYGHTGTFYFLSRLQYCAKFQSPDDHIAHIQDGRTYPNANDSVINQLHSSDYSAARAPATTILSCSQASPRSRRSDCATVQESEKGYKPSGPPASVEVEKECVRLYFLNLHCIHPVLDQSEFFSRCEREVWVDDALLASTPVFKARAHTRFLALFYIVVAVGAITAGDDSSWVWSRLASQLDQTRQRDESALSPSTYPPIRMSQLFFDRAKLFMEDTFETSSFETAQTLFLMSVFCQNALKPHSCYMYSGMALRTCFAIGIPSSLHSASGPQSRLWWALYSHEIEMCASAGRQSFLREPGQYRIRLPADSTPEAPSISMINLMVELASILCDISANTCGPDEATMLRNRSAASTLLNKRLSIWKSRLPAHLNFEGTSLDEAELITKQKIVLKLRFLNARILLHRPFLISAAAESCSTDLSTHTAACVQASRETISFVHMMYMYRPYFRTWWYNCTYVLDATMILLYVILTEINNVAPKSLMQDIEKGIDIFRSMRKLAVARKCIEITREVLDIVKRSQRSGALVRNPYADLDAPDALVSAQEDNVQGPILTPVTDIPGSSGPFEGTSFATLIDSNLLNFLQSEDWDGWTDMGA